MDSAKIHLSEEELQLVQNASVLLTKNRIIRKVYEIFGAFADDWQLLLKSKNSIDPAIFSVSPKISRGENYQSLPYVMLDYPRVFDKTNVCAVRTFFWWGNYFSITLQLKGKWQLMAIEQILQDFDKLAAAGFYIGVSTDEWRYDIQSQDYRLLEETTKKGLELLLQKHPFCKLSNIVPLNQWYTVDKKLNSLYEMLVNLLDFQLPKR